MARTVFEYVDGIDINPDCLVLLYIHVCNGIDGCW